ncbi:NUDIX hydrolase [Roseospira visakhapatnamensis]|nr:DUF4743 domain-containing protein [Roseospira visakhapatnamensis]
MNHIHALNRHDMGGFRPFFVAGREVGWVRHALAERLAEAATVFEVGPFGVALRADLGDAEARTQAIAAALAPLVDDGVLPPCNGESYTVAASWGEPALFTLDRAHVAALGVRAYGVHLNGYVRRPDGLFLWVARRAAGRGVAPGKLDNMVAGGHAAGLTLWRTLEKECAEEAGIGPALVRRARPAGLVSYCRETSPGLRPDTLFVFDLEVPADVEPRNTDGEISDFMLWSVDKVLETVRVTEAFKFNVPLVILDFAIRHGLLTADAEPEYCDIVQGLRRGAVSFHPPPE